MVFVRPRCAEQRHDAVTLDLVYDAVVTVHGLFHEVEHRLKTPHPKLGIAQTVDQTRRIPNIGKQDREVFALATFGAERTQYLVWSRIGTDSSLGERHSAMTAEAAGRSVSVMAAFAFEAEWRAAAFAIAVLRAV
jgi:hypothetical protein